MGLVDGKYNGSRFLGWEVVLAIGIAALCPLAFLKLEKSAASKIVLEESGILILDSIYGRTIPYTVLQVDKAEQVKLRAKGPLARINGVHGMGYCSGWFRLGSERTVFLMSTDCHPDSFVLYIPTSEGYPLVLGGGDLARLDTQLRQRTRE
jgi:hypothetical protein